MLAVILTGALDMEKAMAAHSSTLAWKLRWIEEPGGLQSMRSLRVGHDWSDLAAAAVSYAVNVNNTSIFKDK